MANNDPVAGVQTTLVKLHASVPETEYATVALHWVGSVSTVRSPGQFSRGGSVSTTTMSKAHARAFPAASVPWQTTVVVPMGNSESDGGTHATVGPGQLSVICAKKVARKKAQREGLLPMPKPKVKPTGRPGALSVPKPSTLGTG